MAGEVIVDALPYIDHGYDDQGVRESALAMVEEECRRYRPTKNYLEHLPQLQSGGVFETKLMQTEFERIQNRLPMETLSMKRYELPPPPASKLSEVNAWQESIDNSMAQLEHQWVRSMNLELMLEFGIEAWKAYLEVLVSMLAKTQNSLQELKKQIQDINWQRKQAQTLAGEKLKILEANWVVLVSKNYEIEQQCAELEEKLNRAQFRFQQLKDANQVANEERDAIEEINDNNDDEEEKVTTNGQSNQNDEEIL